MLEDSFSVPDNAYARAERYSKVISSLMKKKKKTFLKKCLSCYHFTNSEFPTIRKVYSHYSLPLKVSEYSLVASSFNLLFYF